MVPTRPDRWGAMRIPLQVDGQTKGAVVEEKKQPVILVVDDEESVQKIVELILKRAGMETIKAYNAAEAAQVLRQRPLPDLLVLDLMLPDVSGIDFLQQMRAKPVFDNLPVLILSALADPDQIRTGLAQGADRYLTKPYMANNLLTTVQELLRSGRRRSE